MRDCRFYGCKSGCTPWYRGPNPLKEKQMWPVWRRSFSPDPTQERSFSAHVQPATFRPLGEVAKAGDAECGAK